MTEESKYYVPDISELHPGMIVELPFQCNGEVDYHKIIVGPDLADILDIKYDNMVGKILSVPECLRVKQLDKEDIESLGFKESHFSNTDGNAFYKHSNYTLHHIPKSCAVRITKRTDDGGNIMLFNGFLKNKSELSRLMKQIGIL